MSTDSSTGIQSAEIALDVLTRLAELGGAQSVSELGRSLDMPRAKVHRYLVSLERRGYVEQDPPAPAIAWVRRRCTPGWPHWPRSTSSSWRRMAWTR